MIMYHDIARSDNYYRHMLPPESKLLSNRQSGSPQGIHFQHKTMVNDGGT